MGGLTDTDDLVLEELDADWEIVCDYADKDRQWCQGNRAEWLAYWRCPHCGAGGVRAICSPCKELVMTTPMAGGCIECDEYVEFFRHLFVRFEPLKP